MVMAKFDSIGSRKLRKTGSNDKGRTFDQDGSAMDLVGVKPLSSTPLAALVPNDTSQEDVPVIDITRQ